MTARTATAVCAVTFLPLLYIAVPRAWAQELEYQVRAGDTLYSIGQKYGLPYQLIAELNGVTEPRSLEIGRRLRIPAPRGSPALVAPPAEPLEILTPTERIEPQAAPPVHHPQLEARLAEAWDQFYAADFEGTLDTVADLRVRLELIAPDDAELRARVALLTGIATVAFGNDAEAATHFERALSLDPTLTLDPNTTSPKILTLFETTRTGAIDPTSQGEARPQDGP